MKVLLFRPALAMAKLMFPLCPAPFLGYLDLNKFTESFRLSLSCTHNYRSRHPRNESIHSSDVLVLDSQHYATCNLQCSEQRNGECVIFEEETLGSFVT